MRGARKTDAADPTTALGRLRRRFEHVPGEHRPHPVRNGVVFLTLIVALLYMGYSRNIPFINEGGQEVSAIFPSANNIIVGNDVRVSGVSVGKVKAVERAESGEGALITMTVEEDAGVEVKRDARASVYWRTLLGGNFYIELDPGSKSAETLGNEPIGLDRTSSQVEFDQLLQTFNGDARQGVQGVIREFDDAFDEEAPAGRSLEALSPAMREVSRGLPALRGTRPGRDLPDLARNASRALGALARDEERLAGLIESGEMAFAVTAARRQDIGSMLEQAPGTLRDTRVTMARLRRTLDEIDPVADGLRPGLRSVKDTVAVARPALTELKRLTPVALPFLRDVDPAIRSLRRASRSGVPLLRDLTPTLERTRKEINPFLDARNGDTQLKNSWAIGPFFAALGSSAGTFDKFGHVQNFQTGTPGAGSSLGAADCDKRFDGQSAEACKQLVGAVQKSLEGRP